MAKKTKEVISYFEDLYKNKAIYLWGANGQIITKELCDKLYATYGTSTYNKTYYNNKLKEGQGKIGADCSGAMYAMSGFDTTAQGYYDKCTTKGTISGIDKSKPCLVFKKSGSKMNHIGFYCGNGYTIEMESSKTNCVKRSLSAGTWTHYGIPSWIDYSDWKTTSSSTSTTNIKGIDVSSYQGNIDWKKVAADGVKFVILRGTLKNGTMDTTFEKNYKGAIDNGLDVAVYHFSYALDSNTAINDAINLVNKLNGKKLPIWLDLEWSTQGKLGKAKISEIAVAFVQACKNLGYECHIYSNLDWYKNYYEPTILASIGCKFWIARYGANNGKYEEKYKPNVGEYIWQYTSKGSVNGISGNVDMNMKFETGSNSSSSSSGNTSSSNSSSTALTSIQKMVKIICKNGVNRRTTPNSSISSNKIGVYKYGATVEVVGITQDKSWYKDTSGNYFTANTEWVTDLTGKVYNCTKLNLRSTATSATNNNKITVLDVNDTVSILKKSGNWYYVETEKGVKGYVSGSYIKLN